MNASFFVSLLNVDRFENSKIVTDSDRLENSKIDENLAYAFIEKRASFWTNPTIVGITKFDLAILCMYPDIIMERTDNCRMLTDRFWFEEVKENDCFEEMGFNSSLSPG